MGFEVRLEAAAAQVNVLVDASVWSLALKRPTSEGGAATAQLVELIRVAHFDQEIARLVAKLPDYDLFANLPGAGPTLAPRLLAAFGER